MIDGDEALRIARAILDIPDVRHMSSHDVRKLARWVEAVLRIANAASPSGTSVVGVLQAMRRQP